MRKFKFTLIAFMAAMMALSFTACSDDDPEPNPNPDPEVNEDNYHFDLFVTVDKHGGMSSKNTTIVHSVNSLAAEQGVITVKREGSELGDYSMETISDQESDIQHWIHLAMFQHGKTVILILLLLPHDHLRLHR